MVGSRRRWAVLSLVVVSVLMLPGCDVAKAGTRCKPNGKWGRDNTHILRCENGRWKRSITIQQYAQILLASAPTTTRPPPTTTTTTTRPPAPPKPKPTYGVLWVKLGSWGMTVDIGDPVTDGPYHWELDLIEMVKPPGDMTPSVDCGTVFDWAPLSVLAEPVWDQATGNVSLSWEGAEFDIVVKWRPGGVLSCSGSQLKGNLYLIDDASDDVLAAAPVVLNLDAYGSWREI